MDKIEKSVLLRAPRSRVWRALTNETEFGEWFHAIVKERFQPGARTNLVSTYPGYEGKEFYIVIVSIEPEHTFTWRGHPGGSGMPGTFETLVTFELKDVEGGTLLTVTESGFDEIPAEFRTRAFEGNDAGWAIQMTNIERYVSQE